MTPEQSFAVPDHLRSLAQEASPERLRDALLTVLKVHASKEVVTWLGPGPQCVECGQKAPCRTLQAVAAALGLRLDEMGNAL